MIELLFYTTLACTDADTVIQRIKKHEYLRPAVESRTGRDLKDSVPECNYWDAND